MKCCHDNHRASVPAPLSIRDLLLSHLPHHHQILCTTMVLTTVSQNHPPATHTPSMSTTHEYTHTETVLGSHKTYWTQQTKVMKWKSPVSNVSQLCWRLRIRPFWQSVKIWGWQFFNRRWEIINGKNMLNIFANIRCAVSPWHIKTYWKSQRNLYFHLNEVVFSSKALIWKPYRGSSRIISPEAPTPAVCYSDLKCQN